MMARLAGNPAFESLAREYEAVLSAAGWQRKLGEFRAIADYLRRIPGGG
jgi:hypothetical protein